MLNLRLFMQENQPKLPSFYKGIRRSEYEISFHHHRRNFELKKHENSKERKNATKTVFGSLAMKQLQLLRTDTMRGEGKYVYVKEGI